MRNYIDFKDPFPWRVRYCYLDRKEHFADQLFINNDIKVKFTGEGTNPDFGDYKLVFCSVSIRHFGKMKVVFEQLKNKMLLLGYTDYETKCEKFSEILKANGVVDED